MRARGLAVNSGLALAGDLASKTGALLVVLLTARLFSVSEFAVLATALAAAGLITSAVDMGAGVVLTRDGAKGPAARGALLRALLVSRAPVAAGVVIVGALVGVWIGRPLTALAVVALALTGAFGLSVLGLYRASQDLRPEAWQRVSSAGLSIAVVLVCGLAAPRAPVLIAGLALVSLLTLLPLVLRTRSIATFDQSLGGREALRRSIPIGLVALATIAYYRSGTLALAALSDPRATAAFSVAASFAFALLMLPNAITTALLPRLSSEPDLGRLAACARRSLTWTLALAVPLAAGAAATGPLLFSLVLGPAYSRAALPFALLCIGIPAISASGVIGTALVAVGRLRELGMQVACSLLVNLVALAVLAPSLGAVGASLATLACETAGLVLLLRAARRALPGMITGRRFVPAPPLGSAEAAPSR